MAEFKLERLLKEREKLPRKQRQLCDYILKNAEEVSLMPVAQLSEHAGVGEATVFRFLDQMNYESYSDFRKELHAYAVQAGSSSYWQMKALLKKREHHIQGGALYESVSKSVENLEKSITAELTTAFEAAVEQIVSARHLCLLGLRSSKPIALYFESILCPFYSQVRQLSHDESFLFDRVSQMGEGDVLFIITDWPYTKTTAEIARFCHEQGRPIILLTNNISCSVASLADVVLLTKASPDRSSRIPGIAVIEALVEELAARCAPESGERIAALDQVLKQHGVSEW